MTKDTTRRKLKYEAILEEFMALREWADDLQVDEDDMSVTLNTAVSFESQSGRLIVEASDKADIVKVYFYYAVACKESKFNEMSLLFDELHRRIFFGRFVRVGEGRVRWEHFIDFEGSGPTGQSVERMVDSGWRIVAEYAPVISAVALTKQDAAEALAEFDAETRPLDKGDSD